MKHIFALLLFSALFAVNAAQYDDIIAELRSQNVNQPLDPAVRAG